MTRHRILITKICTAVILFVLSCGVQQDSAPKGADVFDPSKSDAKAIAVADQTLQAMGGKPNWGKVRYLSFHWNSAREGKKIADFRHDWDRYRNRYRVEGTNRDGEHFVVLFNTETKEGEAYVKGEKMPADSTKKWIDYAYARYINDSYWFLMPFKIEDAGVILTYDGERDVAGNTYDVINLKFENVGLTPGDTYWAFINRNTHLMDKWEYVLQGQQPPATVVWWKDWQSFDGIKLALDRQFQDRPARIFFTNVTVSTQVPDKIFQNTTQTF